jgi:flagellar hook-associated protein 1 FlgK
MSGSLLQVALSGIQAAQLSLDTTGHNIANVNTPGYSRQSVHQVAQHAVQFGQGWVGSGVYAKTITRSYNDLLAGQLRAADSQSARALANAQNIDQINNLLGDPNGSLSGAVSNMFASIQAVTVNPNDVALRQAIYTSAQAVVQRFKGMDRTLSQQRDQLNQQVNDLVATLNSQTQQIADMNNRIVTAIGGGRSPNDLLDQRDAMLNELNKLASVTVTNNEDGSVNVYLSNGQSLLNGSVVQKLGMVDNPLVQDASTVGVITGSITVPLGENGDIGGQIGGLIAARDGALTATQNAIGRMARVFTSMMNSRNHLGLDRSGNPGGDIFSIDAPAVAAAAGNTGGASLTASVTDASALQASDYRVQATASGYNVTRLSDNAQQSFASAPISIDGLQIDVSGSAATGDSFVVRSASGTVSSFRLALSDANGIATASPIRIDPALANSSNASAQIMVDSNDPALLTPATLAFDASGNVTITTGAGTTTVPYTAGQPISMNGWSVTIKGTPVAGDTFQIGPNTSVDGDNRNALAMAALETQTAVPGLNLGAMYSSLVVDIGSAGRDATAASAAAGNLASSLQTAKEAATGVNLDEEAINLMRFQQAYQAAGRMISVANSLFDAILHI